MPLPCFSVTGSLRDIPGSNDDGELDSTAIRTATVVFTPNVKETQPVTFDGDLYWIRPVTVSMSDDGSISDVDNDVLLLANDPGLSISGLQWQAQIFLAGRPKPVVAWWFDAPGDGDTIDLAEIAEMPAALANPQSGPETFVKDEDDVLDYEFNWAGWLKPGDSIVASNMTVDDSDLDIDSDDFTATTATVVVSGGEPGVRYVVTNHITTAHGLEEDWSIRILIRGQIDGS